MGLAQCRSGGVTGTVNSTGTITGMSNGASFRRAGRIRNNLQSVSADVPKPIPFGVSLSSQQRLGVPGRGT